MTKSKKNIFLIVSSFVLLILVAFLSFMPFNNGIVAYADSVGTTYSFTGSNFNIGVHCNSFGSAFGSYQGVHLAEMQYSFTITDDANISLSVHCLLPEFSTSSDVSIGHFQNSGSSKSFPMNNTYTRVNLMWAYYEDLNTGLYTICYIAVDSNFTGNVNRVVFGSDLSEPLLGCPLTYYNYVAYFDVDGGGLWMTFERYDPPIQTLTNIDYLAFDYRMYYLNNPSNFTDNELYNAGYQSGYLSGSLNGYDDGYDDGYSLGNSNGYNTGYDTGFNDGVNDSNQYTFSNLFGAVLDAPVQVFKSLLNFNLLGVNLLGLITGLFTLCIIVLIIKLCLGGK